MKRVNSFFVTGIAVPSATAIFLNLLLISCLHGATGHLPETDMAEAARVELGRALFEDASLSRDGKLSCRSCHDPAHAYSDSHARSIGIDGQIGTRNAPSLIGVGDDAAFTWDGRRTRLEEVVLDPFTNPVELGLPSQDAILAILKQQSGMTEKFRAAFPDAREVPSLEQVKAALAAFVKSLTSGNSAFDIAMVKHSDLKGDAERGRRLFEGVAGCSECHTVTGTNPRFSDGQYHHSGVGQAAQSGRLAQLATEVAREDLDAGALGPKVLSDADWSSLGRFNVSHKPSDIGSFRTPSLRNVAVTAPYMHDGSIATLEEAVDQEIYYRGFSKGHPINLSLAERQELISFLMSLTDEPSMAAGN